MCAVELVEDPATRVPVRLGARGLERLDQDLRRRGVLCFADNPLILAPPLVVTEEETDRIVDAVVGAVDALAAHRSSFGRRPL
jgi:adenosylmethionine-8-amino-7-oxononanoate aminotransferase